MAMRSARCSLPSLRIKVWARKARFIGVFGSSEEKISGVSLTNLQSAALVRKVRPTDFTRRTGVSARSRL